MVHWPVFGIGQQVLLADIGDIAAVRIFGEKMVERLILMRANSLWNGVIPFFAIGEDRVDIKHDAAKIEYAVAHDIADGKAGFGDGRHFWIRFHGTNIVVQSHSCNLALGKAGIIR